MTIITILDKLPGELQKRMEDSLGEYEATHDIELNYKKFNLVLTNPEGESIAVLSAYTVYAEVYVDEIWVDSIHRHKGYGRKLLKTLELHFSGKGFNNINLVTNQFQAPVFYQKCGFTLEFIRENKQNPKLNKYFFVKYLHDQDKTYGVTKLYENKSEWFDEHRSRDFFEKPYLDKGLNDLPDQAKVLDLGCGTGLPITQYLLEKNFQVTGVDNSKALLNLARSRLPQATFIQKDMQKFAFNEKYNAIIAWHSLFHLPADDQRKLFRKFAQALLPKGKLIFTSGIEAGESYSDNGGEPLYHASLALNEYRELLLDHQFEIVANLVQEKACRGATIWIAQRG